MSTAAVPTVWLSLLQHLETWKGRMSKQWKARANANQAAIERGDPFGYAEVYKGLTQLEVRQHDLSVEPIPAGDFDLAWSRWVAGAVKAVS